MTGVLLLGLVLLSMWWCTDVDLSDCIHDIAHALGSMHLESVKFKWCNLHPDTGEALRDALASSATTLTAVDLTGTH